VNDRLVLFLLHLVVQRKLNLADVLSLRPNRDVRRVSHGGGLEFRIATKEL
jgi:hypothetical protein